MTPDPFSPRFIIHEVPEFACDNSKKLSQYFFLLRDQIEQHRWKDINKENLTLTYSTYNGCTEVELQFVDYNKHTHHFIMRLMPDNGCGDTDEDSFALLYLFEGSFDENVLSVRSFAEYLADYLHYEGFEPELINCEKGLSLSCSVKDAYSSFCNLVDITLSKIKPLVWFYTKEPNLKTFDEVCYYLEGVKSQLQLECCRDRWHGVNPKCIITEKFEAEREIALSLTYHVEDVWDLHINAIVADCKGYFDMCCTFNISIDKNISEAVRKELNTLFADFLSTLKISKGNTYVGYGELEHSVCIQYFFIEDTFEIFCSMLDEIVPALQNFKFQLLLQPVNLTGKIETIKKQMEAALHTTFEVETEEEQINKKLKNGYFQ